MVITVGQILAQTEVRDSFKFNETLGNDTEQVLSVPSGVPSVTGF